MFALIKNGSIVKYPYPPTDMRRDNPDTSFPAQISDELMLEFGAVNVFPTPAPVAAAGEVVDEGMPVFIGGRWEQTWVVRSKTPEEIASAVPQQVTPLQAMLAIDQYGMASAYEAWANDPARTFAEKAFINRAQVWNRNDPLMIGWATALGLTSEQLDQLFVLAATL